MPSAKVKRTDSAVTIELALIEVYVSINNKLSKIKNDIDSIIRTSVVRPSADDRKVNDLLKQSTDIINGNSGVMANIVKKNKGAIAAVVGLTSALTTMMISSFLSDEEEAGAFEANESAVEESVKTDAEKSLSSGDLGFISEKYEAGKSGSSAIGYDTTGGTSYGRYQLASKQGTMDEFVKWAAKQGGYGKEVANALKNAGRFNTGSTSGEAPRVWRKLAKEGKLEQLEKDFIKHKYYDVSLGGLNKPLNEMVAKTPLLGSMLWSASVNHGPSKARMMFNSAYKEGMNASDFISEVYSKRIAMVKNNPYADTLINRYQDELNLATSILDTTGGDFKMEEGGAVGNILVMPMNEEGARKVLTAVNEAATRLNMSELKLRDYEFFFSENFIPLVGKVFEEALQRYHEK